MGRESSKADQSQNQNQNRNRNEEIERELLAAKKREEGKVKILLLGPEGSGKSTICKQMRIAFGSPFTDDELRMYRVIVRSNVITGVRKLCQLTRQLGLEKSLDEESARRSAAGSTASNSSGESMCCGSGSGMTLTPREAYDQIVIVAHLEDCTATETETNTEIDPFPDIPPAEQAEQDGVGESSRAGIQANEDARQFLQHVEAIRVLWQSSTIQDHVWPKRAQANSIINDNLNVYLSDLTRIASPTYIPTNDDVVNSRVRTTQITVERFLKNECEFDLYDVGGEQTICEFEFYDVGGQTRSEFRKWISCFNHVDAIIFVAALSGYDQVLEEEEEERQGQRQGQRQRHNNQMIEALTQFESIMKNAHLKDKDIMIFLNKKDIFAEKIMHSNIADSPFFSDYAGPANDFDHGLLYFIQKFEEHLEEDEFKDYFIHVTCATDTANMVFSMPFLVECGHHHIYSRDNWTGPTDERGFFY